MLRGARRSRVDADARDPSLGTIEWIVGNLCDLREIPAGTFDAVVSLSALEHIPIEQLGTALSELARVSKPDAGWAVTTSGTEQAATWLHEPSQGWCYSVADLKDRFGAIGACEQDPAEMLERYRGSAYLREHLAAFYRHTERCGMPWGIWDPDRHSRRIGPGLMVANALRRVWESPTVMTWGGFGARLLGFLFVLPAVLAGFPAEVVSVWLLFVTLSGLQLLADMGFAPTFSRVIAYAAGGADVSRLSDHRSLDGVEPRDGPNWQSMGLIVATMRPVYVRLALMFFGLMLVFGTWSLRPPRVDDTATVARVVGVGGGVVHDELRAVFEFLFVVSAGHQSCRGAAAMGNDHRCGEPRPHPSRRVPVRRSLIPCYRRPGYTWIQIFRNRWLCHRVDGGRFTTFLDRSIHREVFDAVWPSAWRSALAVLMGFGLLQASGILYAQIGSAAETASYLLAVRMIQAVSAFSQAPFYTKLPYLARLRAEGNHQGQVRMARRGMTVSYWTYVAGFVGIGLFADVLLQTTGSRTSFVDPNLWCLLGLAMFAERYGAMHLDLYSTTNHIISHVANGVAGLVFVAVSALLVPAVGVYAFPAGLLAGNVGFYAWYSVLHSYRAFNLRFWSFERSTMLPPLAVVLLYSGWAAL